MEEMMDTLIALLPGIAAIGAAVIMAIWHMLRQARAGGIDSQKVKEAEARAKDLERIKAATSARPGSMHNDPNNRDTR